MKEKFTDSLKAKSFPTARVQRIFEEFSKTRRENHKEKKANWRVSNPNQLKKKEFAVLKF